MTQSRILIASLIAAIAVSTLAGCTGSVDKVGPHTPKPSASASASADAKPGVTDITDTPGSGEDLVGALADSKITTCALTDGKWKVAGTVTNPSTDTAKYRIYVSLLSGSGATRALQQVDVNGVKAGATTDWDTVIPVSDDGLNCVLRVERYAV